VHIICSKGIKKGLYKTALLLIKIIVKTFANDKNITLLYGAAQKNVAAAKKL